MLGPEIDWDVTVDCEVTEQKGQEGNQEALIREEEQGEAHDS
jgi:hypothetical protein